MEDIDELRERAIEYLLAQRQHDKKPHELSAKECADFLGITNASVYSHMDSLVKSGEWETHYAFDTVNHKTIRVWSLKVA